MAQKKKTTTKKAAPKRRKPAAKAKGKTAAKRTSKQGGATKARNPRLPAVGTTITRTFKGKEYALRVTADGFALGDVAFPTLTAAAKSITGYDAISGPRFWLGADDTKGGA